MKQTKPNDAAKPTDSALDCLSAYRTAILNIHNMYRSRHQVGSLQQNASIGAPIFSILILKIILNDMAQKFLKNSNIN